MMFLNKEYLSLAVSGSIRESHPIPGMVSRPQPKMTRSMKRLGIPDFNRTMFTIDQEKKTVSMDIIPTSMDDSASSIVLVQDWVLTFKQAKNFVHDYTFLPFTDKTDKPFRDFYPLLNDNHDSDTPDMIENVNGIRVIQEFATTQSDLPRLMTKDFDRKVEKYYNAISKRVRSRTQFPNTPNLTGFLVWVISDTTMVSNSEVTFDEVIVDELCARYRFAQVVREEFRAAGVPVGDSLEDFDINTIEKELLSIEVMDKPDASRFIPMSKDFWDTTDLSEVDAAKSARAHYVTSLNEGNEIYRSRMKLTNKTTSNLKFEYRKILEEVRTDSKTILTWPSFYPTGSFEWKADGVPGSEADVICQLMNGVLRENWYTEMTEEEMIARAERDKGEPLKDEMKNRKLYKRVTLEGGLPYDVATKWAMSGVQAKKNMRNCEVKENRERTQKGFSLNTHTQDIDVHLGTSLELEEEGLKSSATISLDMLKNSTKLHQQDYGMAIDDIQESLKTKDAFLYSFIEAIATELCISLKQNVNENEFVVKKLREWPAYLIIKPTKQSSHIFYRIVTGMNNVVQVLPGKVGRNIEQMGDNWGITDWCSLTVSKLVNACKCRSDWISQTAQWGRHYGLFYKDAWKNEEVRYMSKLVLLVSLEDKPRTEEILTLFRYISFEKFSKVGEDKTKMIEKMPYHLMSRLQVWSANRMIEAMASPAYTGKLETIDKKTTRSWSNMVNPFTKRSVDRPSQLIELYYVGYATNKDASNWENSEMKLVEKIVKYEDELEKVDAESCRTPYTDKKCNFHEWKRDLVCASADNFRRHLRKLYGRQYETKMDKKVLRRFRAYTWDDVATLKASSTFDPTLEKSYIKNKAHTKRIKVIVAVMKEKALLGATPVDSLAFAVRTLDERGGLNVDIFKKNQHGGLREIYILDIYGRLVQLFLESIARTYCSEAPIEMMMHPENKITKPQEHMFKSASRKEKFRSNISSSNDARIWNQGHHVVKFAQFMVRATSEKFHGLITRGLGQWLYKRVQLPDGLMNTFNSNKFNEEKHYTSKTAQMIWEAWKGINQKWWLAPGSWWLETESGMFQGILHYISSWFHASALMLRDVFWKDFAEKASIKSETSDMVSSDDSGRQTDIFSSSKEEAKKFIVAARVDHLGIDCWSNAFGIFMSPKSTYCTEGAFEFNSEFFFKASLCRPTLKWSLASNTMVEVESLQERQEVCANLIKDLLEGGSGFHQAHCSQVAQGLLHYNMMGSQINKLFGKYCDNLISLKDPSLGYFLMDPPLICGMAGSNYNLWNAVKSCEALKSHYSAMLDEDEMTTTKLGTLTAASQIRFGDRKKARKLVESLENVEPEWREIIEKTPRILYEKPRDKEFSFVRLMVKMTTPGVVRSLSKGNSISRMIAASSYIINGHATTLGSNWEDILDRIDEDHEDRLRMENIEALAEGMTWEQEQKWSEEMEDLEEEKLLRDAERKKAYLEKEANRKLLPKTSLWRLLMKALKDQKDLTEDRFLALFPNDANYTRLKTQLKWFNRDSLRFIDSGSYKSLRSTVTVFTANEPNVFSLEEIVKYKWFAIKPPTTNKILEEVWREYQRIIPWLRDSPEETLKQDNCHFKSQIQLHNFIVEQKTKGRTIKLTGSPVRDHGQLDILINAIRYNQMLGKVLSEPTIEESETNKNLALQSAVVTILKFPFNKTLKATKIEDILDSMAGIWSPNQNRGSPRQIRLGIIQWFVKNYPNTEYEKKRIFDYIMRSKLGVVGGFIDRQAGGFGDRRGGGTWRGRIGDANVTIYMRNDKLEKIETSSIQKLREQEVLLGGLMRDFELTEVDTFTSKKWGYNLKSIGKNANGAEVVEDENINLNFDFQNKLKLSVSNDSIRIVGAMKLSSGEMKPYTLLAYHAQPYDFNKTLNMLGTQGIELFKAWQENKPLALATAKVFLEKVRASSDWKKLDPVDVLDFVREGLQSALYRDGWSFSTLSSFEGVQQSVSDTNIEDLLFDMDFLDNFEMSFDITESKVDEIDIEALEELDQDAIDMVLGSLSASGKKEYKGDLRRSTNVWLDYVNFYNLHIKEDDKSRMASGYLPRGSKAREFAKNLEYFLGIRLVEELNPIVEVDKTLEVDQW